MYYARTTRVPMIESAFMEDAQACRGYVHTCTVFPRTREYLQKRQKSQTYLPGAQGTSTQTGLENHMNVRASAQRCNGSRPSAKVSAMPDLPARAAKSRVADDPLRRRTADSKTERIRRTRTGPHECLEKTCKHVRHGQNTPRRLDKVRLTC